MAVYSPTPITGIPAAPAYVPNLAIPSTFDVKMPGRATPPVPTGGLTYQDIGFNYGNDYFRMNVYCKTGDLTENEANFNFFPDAPIFAETLERHMFDMNTKDKTQRPPHKFYSIYALNYKLKHDDATRRKLSRATSADDIYNAYPFLGLTQIFNKPTRLVNIHVGRIAKTQNIWMMCNDAHKLTNGDKVYLVAKRYPYVPPRPAVLGDAMEEDSPDDVDITEEVGDDGGGGAANANGYYWQIEPCLHTVSRPFTHSRDEHGYSTYPLFVGVVRHFYRDAYSNFSGIKHLVERLVHNENGDPSFKKQILSMPCVELAMG